MSPRTADRLFNCLMLDTWPDTTACIVDFGLDMPNGQAVYGALQKAVRRHGVTADQLHVVSADGPAITSLLKGLGEDIEVKTNMDSF